MVKAPGTEAPKREILIPNGRPTLVICLASPGVRIDPVSGSRIPNDNVVFGITTRPFVLEQLGPSFYIGVQFQPYGLSAFLPRYKLVNEFMPLEDWIGDKATREIRRQLSDVDFEIDGLQTIEHFLQMKIRPLKTSPLNVLQSSISLIEEKKGVIEVDPLADQVHLSYSSLYRIFKQYLGINPKQFISITRYFHFVKELVSDNNQNSYALLDAMNGYYDQAHASRDFKRFTGVSPTSFKNISNGIAVLMHKS